MNKISEELPKLLIVGIQIYTKIYVYEVINFLSLFGIFSIELFPFFRYRLLCEQNT